MVKRFIRKQLNKAGYDIIKNQPPVEWPADFDEIHKEIIKKVIPYTMTSPERIYGLIESVRYITANKIEGAIVECGVWKGGSMLAIAESLLKSNSVSRHLFLYDTFEGMPPPSRNDISYNNKHAQTLLDENNNKEESVIWAYSTLETVKKTMALSSYPQNKIHYIKGKVEESIPATLPGPIALLRLDTDWYESTKHEMIHLYPKLVKGGVLLIDDYGFWKGARKAIDEYISENKIQILLNRLDYTGRIGIKI